MSKSYYDILNRNQLFDIPIVLSLKQHQIFHKFEMNVIHITASIYKKIKENMLTFQFKNIIFREGNYEN